MNNSHPANLVPAMEAIAREAGAFLQDRDPGKRAALIDRLLARDEFADYWAMKWSDLLRVKSEFPINLWPNAVQAYHRCSVCGRPRAYMRRFALCRICFRERALVGELPGVTKSSW